jgi:CHASE2 domain-containing sensor protein
MEKKRFLWDAFGTTIFGVLFLWGISHIDINLDIINPIEKTFEDFELTDIVFSHLRESPPYNEDIVLVNIGMLDRAGIARQIEIINKYDPKVIGVDAFFRYPKRSEDPTRDSILIAGDSALARAFRQVKNLVLGCELHENPEEDRVDSISMSHPMFTAHSRIAYLDMVSEGKNTFKTARHCFLRETMGDSTLLSFPAMMAQIYKPESMEKLEKRNNDTEAINYTGNVNTITKDGTPNSKITFTALDVHQVLYEEFEPDVFKDKMVIMGYMGQDFDTYSPEDRFFTPLNQEYVGRAAEDMYGVVVHANICAMILKGNYIDEMPEFWSDVINVVLIFFNIILFTYFYFKMKIFWDGVTLLIMLAEALLFTTVIVYIFDLYDYKLDFTLATVALFLMPNIIELYYGLIKTSEIKLRRKYRHKQKKKQTITTDKPDDIL